MKNITVPSKTHHRDAALRSPVPSSTYQCIEGAEAHQRCRDPQEETQGGSAIKRLLRRWANPVRDYPAVRGQPLPIPRVWRRAGQETGSRVNFILFNNGAAALWRDVIPKHDASALEGEGQSSTPATWPCRVQ